MTPALLTRRESAEYLRVSLKSFDRHIRPVLRPKHVGSRVLFRPEDLEAWRVEDKVGHSAGARKAALPESLQPELATLVDEPPRDPHNWVFEIKFDGYRMLTRAERGKVRAVCR